MERKKRKSLALPDELMEKIKEKSGGVPLTTIIIIALQDWLKRQK